MMLSTLLLVPLVAIIGVGVLNLSGAIVAITAVMCFIGGLLRILYALMMEEQWSHPLWKQGQVTRRPEWLNLAAPCRALCCRLLR